jgi:DNA-binding CsgD family transcriptional regulator
LSARELEILDYICKGFSNAEIAKTLGLSQRTIDGHRSRLFEKTGAKNAPHLVLFAVKNGLVNP